MQSACSMVGVNNAIDIRVGLSMAETQLKVARAIADAAEMLEMSADSLRSSASIAAFDISEDGEEPKPMHKEIARVKADYAKLLAALAAYEAP